MLERGVASAVSGVAIEGPAHLIQVALTPVFLLTAIAGFLNVFTGRLARVADRVNAIARARLEGKQVVVGLSADINALRRRTVALQAAVVLGGVSGAFTCAATVTIFVGTLGADPPSLCRSSNSACLCCRFSPHWPVSSPRC